MGISGRGNPELPRDRLGESPTPSRLKGPEGPADFTPVRSVSRFLGVFVGTVVLAFGTWAASPMVTGHPEPWDAEYPFYSVLFLAGRPG